MFHARVYHRDFSKCFEQENLLIFDSIIEGKRNFVAPLMVNYTSDLKVLLLLLLFLLGLI